MIDAREQFISACTMVTTTSHEMMGRDHTPNVRRSRGDSPARLQPPFARKETRGSPVVDLGKKNEEKTIDFRRIYVLLHSSWLYKATCKTVYGLSTSQSSSGYLSGNQPNICSQMWLAQIEFCSLRMRKLLSNGTIYLMYANCDIT